MHPDKIEGNLIIKLSFDFGLAIMLFCDKLCTHRKYVISDQLLRAGLSIGANVREAQNGESRADFIHKMKIACKEADETEYYLQLIQKAYNFKEIDTLIQHIDRINKILNKIISTAKKTKN